MNACSLFPLPLQHRAKGSEDPYKEIDGIATTRYSVGGLSPYSHYDFRVAAVNTIGQGPSSDVVEARTAEQAPSSPPRQVCKMPWFYKTKLFSLYVNKHLILKDKNVIVQHLCLLCFFLISSLAVKQFNWFCIVLLQ